MKISIFLVPLQMAALSVGLFVSSQPALATDYVWSGTDVAAATDWFSSKNWKTSSLPAALDTIAPGTGAADRVAGVPGAGDTAIIAAGATVVIDKPLTLAALTVQKGSSLRGTGDITVTSTLTLNDAQVSGDGNIVIESNGTAVLSGQNEGDSTGNILAKGIDNRGTLNWVSGKIALQKDFHNRGKFTVAADAAMQTAAQAGPTFHNEGSLTKVGGNTSILSLPVKNSGDIYLQGGILDVGPDYVQSDGTLNLDGGNLKSSGTLQVDGGTVRGTGTLDCSVVNSGTFKPGHSPGIIYISGNYTQTSSGTLGMEVGGTEAGTGYDQMQIGGSAYLDGRLDIIKYNGYMPSAGLSFQFLQSYDIHNNFTSFSGLYPGSSLYYKIVFMSSSYSASVYSDTTAPAVSVSSPLHNGIYLGVSSAKGTSSDSQSRVKSVTVMLYRRATTIAPSGYLLPGNTTWSSTYSATNQLPATGITSWSYSWPSLPSGQYYVRARATDNVGNVTNSPVIEFTVSSTGSGYALAPTSPEKRSRFASLTSDWKLQNSKPF